MNRKQIWISAVAAVAIVGSSLTFGSDVISSITGQGGNVEAASPLASETTPIRPATNTSQVSAAGNIAVVSEQPVVFQVNGTINEIMVEVGDLVQAGDVLASLDTTDLARTVVQAELNLASNQAQLDKLLEAADPVEVASSQASLTSVQENLLDVQAGPSEMEIAASQANLAAAQARYADLLAGSSEAELIQLQADLERKTISLQQAQWDYDAVAHSDSVGSSPQAAALQQATIDYAAAQAAYDVAVEPASEASIQDALSAIETAKEQLDTLLSRPTAAELASAEAQVASAQAQLESLLDSASAADIRAAEINVEKSALDLEAALADLADTTLIAPIDGTVLSVDISTGQSINSGLNAITLSNLNALELTVNVAEVDVRKVSTDQPAEITIDALPDQVFTGMVTEIAPSSSPDQGVVNYPVTVQLSADDLAQVRPGMTAVATLMDENTANAWLVPTTALNNQAGQASVQIMRNGQPTTISITAVGSQGEWTVVESDQLQAGDQAVGTVSTFLADDEVIVPGQGNDERGGGGPFGRD